MTFRSDTPPHIMEAADGVPGQRLLPQTIDYLAQHSPDRPWASLPKDDDDLTQGFRDVTYAALKRAIDRMCWFIESHSGPATSATGEGSETDAGMRKGKGTATSIAYLGKPDVRYHVIAMAAAKTGYQVLFSSHLNSPVGHVALMKQCSCKALLTARGVQVDDILSMLPMPQHSVPELAELLSPGDVAHYPFNVRFEEVADKPFVILHTSGSTGLPKPLPITHRYCAPFDAQKLLPDVDESRPGYRRLRSMTNPVMGTRVFCPFFPFHVIALTIMLMASVWGGAVYLPGCSNKVTGAEEALDVLEYGNVDSCFVSPALLETWSTSERALRLMSRLKCIHYGGGQLSLSAGNIISGKTALINIYGSTEASMPVLYQLPTEDWKYISFDRMASGFEFRPVDDTLFELVIVRKPDWSMQAVFATRPEIQEWETHDLYEKDPSRDDTWKFASRSDDLLCFAHGNKLNPGPYEEKYIEAAKALGVDLTAAILIGDERQQAMLLAEVALGVALEDLWQVVQKVNHVASAVGQVDKGHIYMTRGTSFVRTAKGTISRRATVEKFKNDIEALYQEHGDSPKRMVSRVS